MGDSPLVGKTVVITGATSGIGLAAAQALAGRGAAVLGVGRSVERCAQAEAQIREKHPLADVTYFVADLAAQRQVRRLAEEVREHLAAVHAGHLDILANNAALVTDRYTPTEDGIELQFAVNHLAPFLLAHELQPELRAAPAGRILTVSSSAHRGMRIFWSDPMFHHFYHTFVVYKQAKLGNVLFSCEFNRRISPRTGLRAYAIDPGLVNTEIGMKGTNKFVHSFWNWHRNGGMSPERGAATLVHLASEAFLEDPTAVYWKNCRPIPPSLYSQRSDVAIRLWELSEKLCGIRWLTPE